jgi:glycosyltransferase involved in cell wall biosynthesis
MRILLLTADFPPDIWSGIGTAVYEQALALARSGHDVHVLAGLPGRRPPVVPAQPELTVHNLSAWRCPVSPRAFDVVHLHSLPLSELALEMQSRFDRPLVYTAHSLLPAELEGCVRADGRFWWSVQRRLLQRSDRVIFLNRKDRRLAVAVMSGLERRSTVVPNGIASPAAGERPEQESAAGRDPERVNRRLSPEPIVFAGRFARTKGLALLAQIIPQVLAEAGHHFVLVGGHGDRDGELAVSQMATRHPDNCRVLPWLSRPALDELLGQAALVLAPSTYEPFGLVALEALRAGTPVLAAPVGGLAETIRPGSGGRLVAAHDPKNWAAEILALMAAPAQRTALGRQGPAYVAAEFGDRKWAGQLTAAYSSPIW